LYKKKRRGKNPRIEKKAKQPTEKVRACEAREAVNGQKVVQKKKKIENSSSFLLLPITSLLVPNLRERGPLII
jgi:hypothetical protein